MKENSKTTCTTAQERTPSLTDPLTKVTFRRTGMQLVIFGTSCKIQRFPEKRSVLCEFPHNYTVELWFNGYAMVQLTTVVLPEKSSKVLVVHFQSNQFSATEHLTTNWFSGNIQTKVLVFFFLFSTLWPYNYIKYMIFDVFTGVSD